MCAGYGLGGGRFEPDHQFGIEPLDTREARAMLDEWLAGGDGRATITGARALNLNPLIRADEGAERTLAMGWWWLWIDGTGPAKYSAFNARADNLTRNWRHAFQHRALLPATWYVEKKVRFRLPNDEAFGIAAVTSTVVDDDTGETRITYSMVTRDSVGEAAETWHRMPLILPVELHDEWLDPGRPGDEDLIALTQLASQAICGAVSADDAKPNDASHDLTLF